ncbi:MAG: hypothetical protein R3C01_07595 [Planctomycetaceae bacterium]
MRRILHHGPSPLGVPVLLDDRAISGCWFELHRQGGCGAGEVVLRDKFSQRSAIDIGDWISFERNPGERWYLGRVEELSAQSPAQVRIRLEGMSIELNEIYPGGFGPDGQPPHRYANTDLFLNDPDYSMESVDYVSTADAAVRLLVEQYVVPATNITFSPVDVEPPLHPAEVTSMKFRGEESTRTIIKELAMRADASWGVDPWGRFFFRRSRTEVLATWREGRDLTSLTESRDRDLLFNRVLLTGDYVYDLQDYEGQVARRSYRFRGNFVQPVSRQKYGERRIRLWIPWLRTQADAVVFVREFFRTYSQPTSRYLIETMPQTMIPFPWEGKIRLDDRYGNELATLRCESIRVAFDHAPVFRLELGPADPRDQWPEPPHDERWELPEGIPPGGDVTFSDFPPPPPWPSDGGGSGDPPVTSLGYSSSERTSEASSDLSSGLSSDDHSSSGGLSSSTAGGGATSGGTSETSSDSDANSESGSETGATSNDTETTGSSSAADSTSDISSLLPPLSSSGLTSDQETTGTDPLSSSDWESSDVSESAGNSWSSSSFV